MPYPVLTFSNISDWENYLNTNWVTNGNEEITAIVGNNSVNGAVKFIKQSPLNWSSAAMYSSGGDIVLSNQYLGVAVFMTTTPDSLSFGDNFYNQYVFINLTSGTIPLGTPTAYYDLTGSPVTTIPANTALILFKTSSALWVQGSGGTGGTGTTQKEPNSFKVGTTAGAPTAGATTWTNPDFVGSWVVLFLNYGLVNRRDMGNGSPFISKTLSSDTLTISNYSGGWVNGDILDYILIRP